MMRFSAPVTVRTCLTCLPIVVGFELVFCWVFFFFLVANLLEFEN